MGRWDEPADAVRYHDSETDPRQCISKRDHALIERARQADPVGLREAIVRELKAWGLDDVQADPPHGWRCQYPDSYGGGPCDCFDTLVNDVAGAVAASLPTQAVEPGPLDVERLAEAMASCDGVNWPKRWVTNESHDFSWVARQVGAAYAHLSPDKQPKGAG